MSQNTQEQLDQHLQANRQSTDVDGLYMDPTQRGVTVAWLANAFEMTEPTARNKLRNCPVKMTRKRGDKMQVKLYDLHVAARYLVTPAIPTREYMRALKRGDLPPTIADTVWAGMLKRQRWEENAGQLWRTDKVREVLGSTFQNLKFTLQLWVDTVERESEMADQQREVLMQLVDALQTDLYDALVKQMRDQSSGPSILEMAEMFGETETVDQMIAESDGAAEDARVASVVESLV